VCVYWPMFSVCACPMPALAHAMRNTGKHALRGAFMPRMCGAVPKPST